MRTAIHKPYHPSSLSSTSTHRRQHSRRLTNPAMYRNCFSDMVHAVKRYIFPPYQSSTTESSASSVTNEKKRFGIVVAGEEEDKAPLTMRDGRPRPVISEPFNFKREGSGLQALQQAQGLIPVKSEI